MLFILTSCWSSPSVNLVIWHGFHFPPLLISTDLIRIESIFIQGLNKVNKTGQEQSSRARRIYLVLSQYKKLPVALSFSLPVSGGNWQGREQGMLFDSDEPDLNRAQGGTSAKLHFMEGGSHGVLS